MNGRKPCYEVTAMRKLIFLTIAPFLLLNLAFAGSYRDLFESYGFPSEEAGTGAYLGVDISDITSERVAALKLKDEHGVEVTMVDQDAPAGKAGIKEHDVILTMNGTTIDSGAQLKRMIRETPPGRVITLGLSRDGQPLTMKVPLADKKKEFASNFPKNLHVEIPPMPVMPDIPAFVVVHNSARSGLMVENITPQLGEFFGVKNGKGVLVRSVERGSRADKAGFRAGDVIVRVNDQTVHDTSDFTHALRSHINGNVTIGIVRDKKEQNITLSLPERKDTGDWMDEESFDIQDMDAEADSALDEIQSEVARMRPEMERAARELSLRTAEIQRLRPQVEQAAREAAEQAREQLCSHSREMRKQQQQLKQQTREMRRQLLQQQRELKKQQQKLQEQLRHELQGEWIEI
jgi:serine protease Do